MSRRTHPGRPALAALITAGLMLGVPGTGLPRSAQLAAGSAPPGALSQPAPGESPAGAAEQVAVIPAGRASIRVPILMYHYIRVNPVAGDRLGEALSVTPSDFAAQLDWLSQAGYHPVDLDDLRGYFQGLARLPARPVVLTFDDGYRDLYTTAFPLLRKHGFKAVAYIVSGFLGAPNNVTSEQVVEMDRAGIQIASHTVSHPDLTRLGAAALEREVAESRSSLERLLGHPVLDFCYPAGRFDERVVRAVEAAGYQSATTTQPGVVHSIQDRRLWSRVRVSGGESVDGLARDFGPDEPTLPESRTVRGPELAASHSKVSRQVRRAADPPGVVPP